MTPENTNAPRRRRRLWLRAILRWLLVALLAVGIAGSAGIVVLFAHYSTQVPPVGALFIQTPKASQIYDRNDNLLSSVYFAENRLPKQLADISEMAIKKTSASSVTVLLTFVVWSPPCSSTLSSDEAYAEPVP
jgi:membrane peptidoglycan carboxypeptidase